MKHFMPIMAAIACMSACTNGANNAPEAEAEAQNPVIEAIMTRASVRQYDPERTISQDTVDIILKAAMAAPTAVNKQPWQFVVLNQRADIDSLCTHLPYAKMLQQAPIAIVPCADLTLVLDGEGPQGGFWIQDLSASTENLLLAAHALGLGAVWTGVYPSPERTAAVQQALGMPEHIIPLCVVPVGYPTGDTPAKDKWVPEKVHYNKW